MGKRQRRYIFHDTIRVSIHVPRYDTFLRLILLTHCNCACVKFVYPQKIAMEKGGKERELRDHQNSETIKVCLQSRK